MKGRDGDDTNTWIYVEPAGRSDNYIIHGVLTIGERTGSKLICDLIRTLTMESGVWWNSAILYPIIYSLAPFSSPFVWLYIPTTYIQYYDRYEFHRVYHLLSTLWNEMHMHTLLSFFPNYDSKKQASKLQHVFSKLINNFFIFSFRQPPPPQQQFQQITTN